MSSIFRLVSLTKKSSIGGLGGSRTHSLILRTNLHYPLCYEANNVNFTTHGVRLELSKISLTFLNDRQYLLNYLSKLSDSKTLTQFLIPIS